jgi:hypothetical protein
MRHLFSLALPVLLIGLVVDVRSADAQTYDSTYGLWWTNPPPDGTIDGNCFGNCGAACSPYLNISCGGPTQYWSVQVLSQPQYQGPTSDNQCVLAIPDTNIGYLVVNYYDVYSADVVWTYHGFVTEGCIQHDLSCGGGFDPGCWWMPLGSCLEGRHEHAWSSGTKTGWTRVQTGSEIMGECYL